MRARELFASAGPRSAADNLAKGKALLKEALMLCPDHHEARIYLGHAHHVAGDVDEACGEFRKVLDGADDVGMRGYAHINLGNVFLEAGELNAAAECFHKLVDSGAVRA